MNIDKLLAEKEDNFGKISSMMDEKAKAHEKAVSEYQKEMTELNEELLRLQGEYRLLTEIKSGQTEEVEAEVIN